MCCEYELRANGATLFAWYIYMWRSARKSGIELLVGFDGQIIPRYTILARVYHSLPFKKNCTPKVMT